MRSVRAAAALEAAPVVASPAESCAMTSRECADADGYGLARRCIACGGSGHSHCTCILLGAAVHRKLDPHKDMTDVVDVILRLLLWDWRDARVGDNITCLGYAPSCDVIAAGSQTGKLVFINAQTGDKILCPVSGHSRGVSCLVFKPDDPNVLVTGSLDSTCKVWELSTGACLSTLSCRSPVRSVAFKDNMIAAGCSSGSIKLFALPQPCSLGEIQYESSVSCSSAVYSMAFKDNIIAVGCDSGEIKILSLAQSGDWEEIPSESLLRGHKLKVAGVAFDPTHPSILVSCSCDKTVKIWDVTLGSCLSTLNCGSIVWSIAFKDNMIAAGCQNGEIKIFGLNESQDWGEIRYEWPERSSAVKGVVFSADGRWFISGSEDGTIRLWDAYPAVTVVSPV